MTAPSHTAEIDHAQKTMHRPTWASGDYAAVAAEIIPDLGAVLVEACGVGPGQRVLGTWFGRPSGRETGTGRLLPTETPREAAEALSARYLLPSSGSARCLGGFQRADPTVGTGDGGGFILQEGIPCGGYLFSPTRHSPVARRSVIQYLSTRWALCSGRSYGSGQKSVMRTMVPSS